MEVTVSRLKWQLALLQSVKGMNWDQYMLNSIDSIKQKIDYCVISQFVKQAKNVLTVMHLQWKSIVQGNVQCKCRCFES